MNQPASTTDLAPDALPEGGRVLLVRLSALGDVLFSLETVAALHAARPDLRIDFLVDDRFAAVLVGHPHLDRVLTVPRHKRWRLPGAIRRLRQRRYDLVLDLHGLLKSAALVRFARARRRVGPAAPIAREGAWRAYDLAVPFDGPRPHRAEQGLRMLQSLGITTDAPAVPRLGLPPEPAECWSTRVASRPRIAIHPGTSSFAAFKRWPVNRFHDLVRRLGNAAELAVSYGPGEESLVADFDAGVRRIEGKALGLLGLGAAYRDADLVIAADTGPLHLAAFSGTPVVALFGPKEPGFYGPRPTALPPGGEHRILFHEVPCRPCRRRRCASPQCMLGLTVDTVHASVRSILQPNFDLP